MDIMDIHETWVNTRWPQIVSNGNLVKVIFIQYTNRCLPSKLNYKMFKIFNPYLWNPWFFPSVFGKSYTGSAHDAHTGTEAFSFQNLQENHTHTSVCTQSQ
jgi:hypothetical protein